MEQKAIAITGEHERHVQRLRVAKGLLHARAQGVLVVLRFDYCERKVRLMVENVVRSA